MPIHLRSGFPGLSDRNVWIQYLPGQSQDPEERGAFEPLRACATFDIWSLGCIFFQMFARRPLWNADRDDNIEQAQMAQLGSWGADPAAIDAALSGISNPLARNLVRRMLSADPSQRPQSVAEVLADPFFSAPSLIGDEAPPLPYPLRWHVFISYHQGHGHGHGHESDACLALKYAVEKAVPGTQIWMRDPGANLSEAETRDGVARSGIFLLFLTKGVLQSPSVLFEVREAIRAGKPVVLVEDSDPRHQAAGSLNDYLAESPEDIRGIFNSVSIPWTRERSHRRGTFPSLLTL